MNYDYVIAFFGVFEIFVLFCLKPLYRIVIKNINICFLFIGKYLVVSSEGHEIVDLLNPKTKYDPVFEMNLSSFQNKAVFKQKIRLLNDSISSISGELEFMVCNATMCLPPDYVDMVFDFKKKTKTITLYFRAPQ